MTQVDDRFAYCELLLAHPRPASVPEPALPEGYRWAEHPETMKDAWVDLMGELSFPFSREESRAFWDAMAQGDPGYFASHLAFVVSEGGELAATCGLWPGRHFSPARPRLHWVMTGLSHQHKGLARAAVARCCRQFAAENEGPLYLSTQAQSWPAILLYESMGFEPYTGAWNGRTAEESAADWAEARRLVAAVAGASI